MEFDLVKLQEQLQPMVVDFGIKLATALAILIIGRLVVKIIMRLLRKALQRVTDDQILLRFVSSLLNALLMVVVLLAAISQLGVQTASLIAVLGAAGLAIGLALQGSLSNFAAGVMLIIFRPYRAGDYIEAGGQAGSVEEVQIFTTVLKTPDAKRVIIPNSQVVDNAIVNYSVMPERRVDMVFGIGYDDDIVEAKRIIEEIFAADERLLPTPAPIIQVDSLGDSSVNIIARPWVNTADYWAVKWDLTERVKLAFDAAGISIPYPQRDVHIKAWTQAADAAK